MPVDLSGPDLDRAIAEAMGFRVCESSCDRVREPAAHWHQNKDRSELWSNIYPSYSTSFDAQRDGPWKMLVAHGLRFNLRYQSETEEWFAQWSTHTLNWFDGDSAALAAARATLSALKAMKHDQ